MINCTIILYWFRGFYWNTSHNLFPKVIKLMIYEHPIFDAAENGNIEELRELLEKNPNLINLKTSNGNITPLMIGIYHFDVVNFLLSRGADVNLKDDSGMTALIFASAFKIEIVALIASKGADVNAKSDYGTTALNMAIKCNKIDIIEYLINKGADVNLADNYGRTPLTKALKQGYKRIADLLRKHGAKK